MTSNNAGMPELLPCPFEKNALVEYRKCQFGHYVRSYVPGKHDDKEFFRSPYFQTANEAVQWWNKRSDLAQAAQGEVEQSTAWQTMESAPRKNFEQIEVLSPSLCFDDDAPTWDRDIACLQAAEYEDVAEHAAALEAGHEAFIDYIESLPGSRPVKRWGWFRPHEGGELDKELFPVLWRSLAPLPSPPAKDEGAV